MQVNAREHKKHSNADGTFAVGLKINCERSNKMNEIAHLKKLIQRLSRAIGSI